MVPNCHPPGRMVSCLHDPCSPATPSSVLQWASLPGTHDTSLSRQLEYSPGSGLPLSWPSRKLCVGVAVVFVLDSPMGGMWGMVNDVLQGQYSLSNQCPLAHRSCLHAEWDIVCGIRDPKGRRLAIFPIGWRSENNMFFEYIPAFEYIRAHSQFIYGEGPTNNKHSRKILNSPPMFREFANFCLIDTLESVFSLCDHME